MSYGIILSENFKKEAKRLVKKYPSLVNDLEVLSTDLSANPTQGVSLGNNVYKIRLAISSKGKGKSGGARVISFIKVIETTVILLAIYDKSDKDAISDKEIKDLIKGYL